MQINLEGKTSWCPHQKVASALAIVQVGFRMGEYSRAILRFPIRCIILRLLSLVEIFLFSAFNDILSLGNLLLKCILC